MGARRAAAVGPRLLPRARADLGVYHGRDASGAAGGAVSPRAWEGSSVAAAPVALKLLDLSQDWDTNTPGFALYGGPQIKWIKRVAFEGVGGMEITSTLHVGTHLDAPNHFVTNAKGIGELPI